MTALAIAAFLQISVVTSGAQNYDEAYRATNDSGRPLVVMVGAEWCPACVQMKQSVMPEVERKGGLKKVAFTYVNTDEQGPLAQKLMRGGSIPQLIVFRKTAKGWSRRQITGACSAGEVESLLRRESAAAEAGSTSSDVDHLSSYPVQ